MRSAALTAAAALVLAGTGASAWSSGASGSGKAKAGAMVGNRPTATKDTATSVALSWAATPGATGYTVARTGGVGSLGGTCTGTVAGTSCSDNLVLPLMTYTYTVTPVAGAWVGTASPPRTITT